MTLLLAESAWNKHNNFVNLPICLRNISHVQSMANNNNNNNSIGNDDDQTNSVSLRNQTLAGWLARYSTTTIQEKKFGKPIKVFVISWIWMHSCFGTNLCTGSLNCMEITCLKNFCAQRYASLQECHSSMDWIDRPGKVQLLFLALYSLPPS